MSVFVSVWSGGSAGGNSYREQQSLDIRNTTECSSSDLDCICYNYTCVFCHTQATDTAIGNQAYTVLHAARSPSTVASPEAWGTGAHAPWSLRMHAHFAAVQTMAELIFLPSSVSSELDHQSHQLLWQTVAKTSATFVFADLTPDGFQFWITLSPRTSEPVRHAPVPPWSKILATPLPVKDIRKRSLWKSLPISKVRHISETQTFYTGMRPVIASVCVCPVWAV